MGKEFYPYLTEREENIIKQLLDDGSGFFYRGVRNRRRYSKKTISIFSSLVRKGWLQTDEYEEGIDEFGYVFTQSAKEVLGLE